VQLLIFLFSGMHQPKQQIVMAAAIYAATALQMCRTAMSFTTQSAFRTNRRAVNSITSSLNHGLYMSTETDANVEKEATLVNNRIPIGSLTSLDSRAVIDNLDLVLSHLKSRRASDKTMDAARQIASRNDERVALIKARDGALQTRNEQSKMIGMLMRNPDRDEKEVEEAKRLSSEAAEEASASEEKLEVLEAEVSALLASIPNLLDDLTPDGDDENSNEEVESWGDVKSLPAKLGWPEDDSFKPLWHDDVAMNLNGWKGENAVAISGARFIALSGHVARLERAISSFFLDMHVNENGYTEVSVPLVVGRSALEGTSQLPKFEEDLFKITAESHQCNGEDAFLIPTAEVPLTNMHRESILEEADLPISYVALTPCFRAEAGSYGRDTRGLIRTHQFNKVEMVKITSNDSSEEQHEELTRHAQACLEALELPYRKVRLCSGDIGFAARHCYDLEVWLPGSKEFREISSCSNTGDFQARRMNLRYRPAVKEQDKNAPQKGGKKKKAKKPKPVFCHTINGSGLAVGRALVAVLENYQMPDGSVVVPDALRPYLGGLEVLKVD
jgi:seryl-tRNA synthetase